MNPDIKQKWIEALRSGKYEQGFSVLKKNNRYCCLGVLCELHSKITNREWIQGEDGESYDDCDTYLPDVVVEWAGLNSDDPSVVDSLSLAQLNDVGQTFEQIAEFIEKNL